MSERIEIGYVIDGSLKEGIIVRLTRQMREIQEGGFVVIESRGYRFYGLIANLRLHSTDIHYSQEQNQRRFPPLIAGMLNQQTLFTEMEVLLLLMQFVGTEPGEPGYDPALIKDEKPMPVKQLPSHHAPVRLANAFDVAAVFKPKRQEFEIGTTREQGHPVHIDMKKFVERSSGIFGATGTGKSYLTRLILAGLIHSKQAAALVFDMHTEYAYGDISPDTGIRAPGLCEKLASSVKAVALGKSTMIKGKQPDFDLVLEYTDIYPSDVEMLYKELNLRETTGATLAALEGAFKKNWFEEFKNMPETYGIEEWAKDKKVNELALSALHSKMKKLFEKDYLIKKAPDNAVRKIIDYLKTGQSVILSFGKYDTDLDYLLVTNVLTRKIRAEWERMTNAHYTDEKNPQPPALVIALEEAHKLLSREIASQTQFATIAREMRKYNVTLLVIDQRPSQIYDEVMSQLGTRITGWLGDDSDLSAVLSGLAGRDSLRGMLSRLQPKEEVLLLGYGIPMPIPVRSRRYDETFWKTLLKEEDQVKEKMSQKGKETNDFLLKD